MQIVNKLYGSGFPDNDGLLFSWIVRYDSLTKTKTRVNGYSIYSPDTSELYIMINDGDFNTDEEWTLDVHLCKNTGTNKPVFIATNVDLNQPS